MDLPPTPEPIELRDRSKFATWIGQRALTFVTVGAVIGVGPQQVRHYCRAWTDTKRQVPRQEVLERIVAWTQGEVTAADFYPPHLNGADSKPEARP